jgi:hypothetical protein
VNPMKIWQKAGLVILCCGSFQQASASTLLSPDIFGGYTAEPLGNSTDCSNARSLCGSLFDAASGTLSGSFSGSSTLLQGWLHDRSFLRVGQRWGASCGRHG